MAYRKKTNLFKRIVFSRTTALVIIFVIIFMGYGLFSLIGKSIDASKARVLAENQASALSSKQKSLSAKLNQLSTADGKEAALREQYPVVKDGEHMVVITGDSDMTTPPPAPTPPPKSGFWDFFRNLF